MKISSILSRLVPFLITITFGVAVGTFFGVDDIHSTKISQPLFVSGYALTIYKDENRQNEVEGVVRLKVTLLASGKVGTVKVEKELPDGLTERAIAATRHLSFPPSTVDDVLVSRTLILDYKFSSY